MQKQSRIISTVVKVALAVSLGAWSALQLRRWDAFVGVRVPGWSRVPGLLLLILGGLVMLLCGGILSTRGILETPGQRLLPKEFVAFGPFRYVRNPMSLGCVTFMLGLGLYESSILMMGFAAVLFLFLHAVVVYVEEPGLEKQFRESYREYKQAVNRWLPKFNSQRVK